MAARTQKLKPEDLSLGLVTRNDLPAAIANAAFTLEKDKVSEPVISPFGFHLLRVTDIHGQVVEDSGVPLGDDTEAAGDQQFPACPAAE